MSARRRRRGRRDHRADHADPARTVPATKAEVRRRAAFESRMARLRRVRTTVGLLGSAPLAASLACGSGVDLPGLCVVPREIYLALWAAVFGTFLGLTFRMWRERRAFERARAAPA